MKNYTKSIEDKNVDPDIYGDYIIKEMRYVVEINGAVIAKFEKDPEWHVENRVGVPAGMDWMETVAAAIAIKKFDGDWDQAVQWLEQEGMDPPAKDGTNAFKKTLEWLRAA